ncbi:MAG: LolA family protein [Candidatus Ratteibacteria bacterium]
MKKILILLAVAGFATGMIFAQSESPKDVLMKRLAEKYKNIQEMSATLEVNMSMLGTTMKIPMKIWTKGVLARVDVSMIIPGTEQKMESTTINDGKTVTTYNNLNNTIMTIDLDKLPEELKNRVKQSTGSPAGFNVEMLNKIKDQIVVEETNKNDKKVYLITVKDIEAIKNSLNMPAVNAPMPFKKILYWIDYESLNPLKMEFIAESDTPGMWIDVLEIKTSVPDGIFKVSFPPDAKKIDMTDSLKGMIPTK